jgi:threonine/homoserine/homoserine lactone efflux protein
VIELLPALLLFSMSSLYTPGPNNAMLAASGATFGLRRSVPHMLGVATGFPMMVLALGLGFQAVLDAHPWIHGWVKAAGAAYLCWMAWHIATASRTAAAEGKSRPFTYLQACAFQWVNPKAWVMAVGALSAFTTAGGDHLAEVALIAAVFLAGGLGSSVLWTAGGTVLGRFLSDDRRLRIFNVTMGLLLVASIVPTVM